MIKKKEKAEGILTEGEKILLAIQEVQTRLICARQGFAAATDEALVDSYIYEITALQKKYDYFLKEAKELGLTGPYRKIV